MRAFGVFRIRCYDGKEILNTPEMDCFDFPFVDDCLLARASGRNVSPGVPTLAVKRIGPAVLYALQSESAMLKEPHRMAPELAALAIVLRSALVSGKGELQPLSLEFSRVGRDDDDPKLLWSAYIKRLQGGAEKAGFPKSLSAGIAGSFREMATNLVEHSNAANTGIVGYRSTSGEFEFVVADQGRGVLESLRESHKHLQSDDEALEAALGGASRYGPNAQRGTGFRTLFHSLAELNGTFRFQSGSWIAELQGKGIGCLHARYATRGHYQGFMISIVVRP